MKTSRPNSVFTYGSYAIPFTGLVVVLVQLIFHHDGYSAIQRRRVTILGNLVPVIFFSLANIINR